MLVMSIMLYIIVGCISAYAFQKCKPNSIPGGVPVGGCVGTVGAWAGGAIPMGPELAGIFLFPCIAGAAFFIFLAAYVRKTIEFNKGT